MEKAVDWEQNSLLVELTQGKELAEQLRNHHRDHSLPPEYCEILLEKILSSYDKALSKLKWVPSIDQIKPNSHLLESSHISLSPKSDYSDPASKDQYRREAYKKRKTQPRWTKQVKVCSGTGLEGPLDDGYSWRKYGQKDILGANYPRAYYRCTHRPSQGCLAIKQVQRSDEDPTIFEVTYRGRHTCTRQSKGSVPSNGHEQIVDSCQIDQIIEEKPKAFENFGEGVKVKIEGMDSREKIFPCFSFPYPPFGNEDEGNNILGTLSLTFTSPPTSESNLFSMSPCHMDIFGPANNLYTSESDLTDIVSAHNSVTNSPIGDLEITIEDGDFNYSFPFDNSELFPGHKFQ